MRFHLTQMRISVRTSEATTYAHELPGIFEHVCKSLHDAVKHVLLLVDAILNVIVSITIVDNAFN